MIETPLMWIDKAATWALAHRLGGEALVDLIVEDTHTCYLGDRGIGMRGATAAGPARPASCAQAGHEKYQSTRQTSEAEQEHEHV